jgi:hypothetical protein
VKTLTLFNSARFGKQVSKIFRLPTVGRDDTNICRSINKSRAKILPDALSSPSWSNSFKILKTKFASAHCQENKWRAEGTHRVKF